ncbi:hypothetical protein BABINDRAFT_163811 [Babjeviella inositovora NRRL Y-12698]|uniref:37S ribosomal protein mrp10, mitochondrial n=1 Tax=Babjeviella inositovora NRRL Y-12698 TaxID=984486 RepID=A0A1E3QHA0_9ASCO|nr:uncharacterized protein BABINDRAFT_163811 [Babjeviella inositovora NRRL Y-12698]ODQ77075.1 hypothetical protein BABINDRAFT_163811 [Babjeviella inositovora NRRL Y-12698]
MPNKPVKLPNLPILKVKSTSFKQPVSPCIVMMSQLLNCWASNGDSAAVCKKLEKLYKSCVDAPQVMQKTDSTINYHARRLLPKINNHRKSK